MPINMTDHHASGSAIPSPLSSLDNSTNREFRGALADSNIDLATRQLPITSSSTSDKRLFSSEKFRTSGENSPAPRSGGVKGLTKRFLGFRRRSSHHVLEAQEAPDADSRQSLNISTNSLKPEDFHGAEIGKRPAHLSWTSASHPTLSASAEITAPMSAVPKNRISNQDQWDSEEMEQMLDMMKSTLRTRQNRSSASNSYGKSFAHIRTFSAKSQRRQSRDLIIEAPTPTTPAPQEGFRLSTHSDSSGQETLTVPFDTSVRWTTLLIVLGTSETYDVVQCHPSTTFEEVLLYACDKFGIDFDVYSLVLPLCNGASCVVVELDRDIKFYLASGPEVDSAGQRPRSVTFANVESFTAHMPQEIRNAIEWRVSPINSPVSPTGPDAQFLKSEQPLVVQVVRNRKSYNVFCLKQEDKDALVIQMADGKIEIMAGLEKLLVDYLTNPEELEEKLQAEPDTGYMEIFMLTFRSFVDPASLFEDLVERFSAGLPEQPSDEDVEFYDKYKIPSQLRILQIITLWTRRYWQDFAVRPELRKMMDSFIETLAAMEGFREASEKLSGLMVQQKARWQEMRLSNRLRYTKSKMMGSMLLEVNPAELASQLTLHDWNLFTQINPLDYLSFIWDTKKADTSEHSSPEVGGNSIPSMTSLECFTRRFDLESFWVATEVCSETVLKKRVHILHALIEVARGCLLLRNFFSAFSIFAGLGLRPVERLKKTWKALPEEATTSFSALQKVFDPSRNMKNYRDALLASSGPTVPFMPIFLKDLTFINDGNEARILDGLVNFEKLRTLHTKVQDIINIGVKKYPLSSNSAVQNYVKKPPVERAMRKLGAMSEICEPRQ